MKHCKKILPKLLNVMINWNCTLHHIARAHTHTHTHTCTTSHQVIEERNQLQVELTELLSERDMFFEEKVQLQSSLQVRERNLIHQQRPVTVGLSSRWPYLYQNIYNPKVHLPGYHSNYKVTPSVSPQEMAAEKRRILQKFDWLSSRCTKYEAVARNLKEQNEVLNGRVRSHDYQVMVT